MRGLIMEVHHNSDLERGVPGTAHRTGTRRIQPGVAACRRRGEIRADNPALDYVPHVVIGGYFARTLIDDRQPTRAFLAEYADVVFFPALGVRLSPSSSPQQ
ncbi:TetR-like C-terminal domain-containing protein [Streptomyces spongiae]|uniref:Tetracyclin repressor-like C-terminal domain-containing protein n=1 Tax=Streptomyces spongiae TaxID=565072 RepID=A0A5N8XCV5_9ACTN|nr:TetR-like C-terminal domain-containing protein [Streptomyces spongiae]MPY57350.1 hypothetical protein [Streptomyces spongiae]